MVLPAFSSLHPGFTKKKLDVTILVNDITGKVDGTSSNVNTVFFFKLNSDNGKSNNVTITLHHTVRKVQVQGSSIISNNMRANVWFLENILSEMFRDASASKSVDISCFNGLVRNFVSNHAEKLHSQQKCGDCDIPFTGRSQCEQCDGCGISYHRRCLSNTSHQYVKAPATALLPGSSVGISAPPPGTGGLRSTISSAIAPPSRSAPVSSHRLHFKITQYISPSSPGRSSCQHRSCFHTSYRDNPA